MSYILNNIVQTFESLFSNFYIPKINFYDIIEISIIVFIFYFVAKAFKNTRTWVLAKGAMLLGVFYLIAYLLSFNVITKIFESAILVFVVGIVVIFSPEIKKFLEKIGTRDFSKPKKFLFKANNNDYKISNKTIDEIVFACEQMSKDKTGALIVYENKIPLNEYIETGIEMESIISRQLLLNVFEHNTPLHDGAVIIKEDILKASTCYLPLSENTKISKRHGTRHRAALGISENTDALTIVVSEETGKISVTQNGKITTVSPKDLRTILENFKEETVVTEKKSIKQILKNNIGLKIVSILFGIVLWLIIMNVSNPIISTTFSAVPIKIENETSITQLNKTYTIDADKFVDVIVTGHRSKIENLKENDIIVTADLSKLSEINTVRLCATVKDSDVETTIKNDIIKVRIENCVDKTFELQIEKTGTEDKTCYVYDITTEDKNFTINGPESIIKIIDKVVFSVDVSQCTGDFEFTATPIIYDKNGNVVSKNKLTLEKETVKFNVLTLGTKEVSLSITPSCDENIKKYINTFSAVPTTVRVAAGYRTLQNLSNLNLTIPINLTEEDVFDDTFTTKVDISEYVPEGIYVPNSQKSIDIVLGFATEITKEFSFKFEDIEIKNNVNNFTITPIDKEFKISIFGEKNKILNTSIEDIKLFIDLTEVKKGRNVVLVEYQENENFTISGNKKITIDVK